MIRRPLLVVLAWLLALGIALAQPIASGFALGFGDRVDAMIEISLLEHWRNVLTGAAMWNAPFYFYPHPGVLGYNDGYFLSGLIYTASRAIADPFLADTLTAATWKTIGFFASYVLIARVLYWGRGTALLVAVLFTIANGMAVQAVHAQLQTVALVPLVFALAIVTARASARGSRGRAIALAGALALTIALWLLTAYYMAWFTLWFGCLFTACWLVQRRRLLPGPAIAALRRHVAPIIIGAVVFIAAALPFLLTYLPKARETGEHHYAAMAGYLVTPLVDMVNVGPHNLMWGWIWRGLEALIGHFAPGDPGLPARVVGGEHSTGFPLLLFALTIVAAWRVLRGSGSFPPLLRTYALTLVVAWALTLQFWLLSPWGLIFCLVPGASGLRVVLRFQLFLILPLLLLVAAVWRHRLAALSAAHPWRAGVVVFLLVAEQINLDPAAAALDAPAQRAALWAIPAPPPACRSFYVVAARIGEPIFRSPEKHAQLAHNVDAMLLAEHWRLPTINGWATFTPLDWKFDRPLDPDYERRVQFYARVHGISGLCRLDVRAQHPWQIVTL